MSMSVPYGMPSTIIRGVFEAFKERLPRIENESPEPVCPLDLVISRPATFPCRLSRALVVGVATMSSDLMEVIDPVKSRFFTTPYPITTTSSRSFRLSFMIIFIGVPAFTSITWLTIPI